jgi:hypothetical protein
VSVSQSFLYWFRRTENITELDVDYKEVGDRVVDVSI